MRLSRRVPQRVLVLRSQLARGRELFLSRQRGLHARARGESETVIQVFSEKACMHFLYTSHTESGNDPTDYTASAKARSFVPFYAQRLSTACVMHGASKNR